MSTCPKCGAKYDTPRSFCGKCRARMSTRCGYCGFINNQDDTYCGGCSAELASATGPGDAASSIGEEQVRKSFYNQLLAEAHADRSFTAQIAETLDQAEIKELFDGDKKPS